MIVGMIVVIVVGLLIRRAIKDAVEFFNALDSGDESIGP